MKIQFLQFEKLTINTYIKKQWRSGIRPSLDFKWPKRGWEANGLDFEWDLKFESPTIWNPDKWQPFCQKPFEIWTKSPDFEWSGFWMVGTIAKARPFEIRPSKIPSVKQNNLYAALNSNYHWSRETFSNNHVQQV